MSKRSKISSLSEEKKEKYFYTVRGKDISDLAKKIVNDVKETVLSEIKWTSVIKGGCFGADCLVVFETGSSNSNRMLDILSGIRERNPSVSSIISVILCTNNSTDHDKVCSSIDNHTFRTQKDTSFECLLFSDGRTHECSRNIGKSIEDQLEKIQEKKRKREENKSRVREWETVRHQMGPQHKPSLQQRVKDFEENEQREISEDAKAEINEILHDHLLDNVRQVISSATALYEWIRHYIPVLATDRNIKLKLKYLLAQIEDNGMDLDDAIKNLEAAIKKFEEQKLEQTLDLTKAKDPLEEKKLKKELKEAIRKRLGLDEAIENTEKSKFKEKFRTLICKAKEVRDILQKQGKYMYPIPKWTPEIKSKIITKFRRYKEPPQVIHDVVLAAFILLGEKKDNLQDWETIRHQMGPQRKPSLQQRVKDFEENEQREISEDAKAEINEILHDHLLDNVRKEWETVRHQMGPQHKPSLQQRVKDFEENEQREISEDAKAEINEILHDHLLDNVRQVSSSATALYEWIRHYIPVVKHN